MRLTGTYTCATLEVSQAAYDEIAAKLRDAGYHHAFDEAGMIDMTHIGLMRAAPPQPRLTPTSCGYCTYDEAEGELLEQCAKCKAADEARP